MYLQAFEGNVHESGHKAGTLTMLTGTRTMIEVKGDV